MRKTNLSFFIDQKDGWIRVNQVYFLYGIPLNAAYMVVQAVSFYEFVELLVVRSVIYRV